MTENTVPFDVSQDRRPIVGWEDRYEIDREGNVYATFAFKKLPVGRPMTPHANKDGYIFVVLADGANGKSRSVHRLMMLTWQPIDSTLKLEVNHIDGNKANNRLDNLEWLTHRDNIQHARTVLKKWQSHRGESIGGSKFNPDIVREIRRLYAAGGITHAKLAVLYGVSPMAIRKIVNRWSWAHVE